MDGYNPQRQLLEQTRKLVKKWEPTGLLEGLGRDHEVNGMAVLLENQARQLIDEASRTGTAASSEEWSGVALPLVRRIFGELAAQEFVSVQPMNLPSGLIFYLDFKYGTAQTGNHTHNADVHGNTSGSGDASGGLYGAGKFGYSVNDQTSDTLAIGASAADNAFATASVAWSDVGWEPDLSASAATGYLADNGLVKITVADDDLVSYDKDGIRAFSISGTNIDAFYPAYTSKNAAGTEVSFICLKSAAAAPASIIVKYHKEAANNYTRGDFEATAAQIDANPETDIDIPELDIALKSIPIIAKTRKLKAVWTPELAQDLNAYHSVDAEAELTALLSEYISMEIDLEILDMLYAGASARSENWSARPGYEHDSATGLFAESSANASAYTKELGSRLLETKSKQYQIQSTRRLFVAVLISSWFHLKQQPS